MMPVLFVRAIKWSFFSSLKADITVFGLRSDVAKQFSMRVAQTKSKFGCGLFVTA